MSNNFGDFQLGVYADAVKGVNSRYHADYRLIERKAAEALPGWVAGQGAGHAFEVPELFTADTSLGHYLVPLGSCYPEWK